MRIGITTHFQFSFFSAGSPQSVLSVAEALRIKGHTVFFINVGEKENTWWEDVKGVGADWTSIHTSALEPDAGDLVIEIGSSILTPENRAHFKKSVWLSRKPIIFHDIESSLFPYDNVHRNLSGVSEVWLIKEHTSPDDIQYAELLFRLPVRLLPFTWTPSAIESYRQEVRAPVWRQVLDLPEHAGKPWSVHICETNTSSSSSSAIPLLIMREVRKKTAIQIVPHIRIHNAENVQKAEFFMKNILDHVCSDTDLSGVFTGRNRVVDFVYDPMSIVVAHSRFIKIRPYLLDLLWMGIPLVHNSTILREFGGAAEAGFYTENELAEGRRAFENITTYAKGNSLEVLAELRAKLIAAYTPVSKFIQGAWHDAAEAVSSSPSSPPIPSELGSESTLRVGFSDMWDGFNPEYNMFLLMLEAARPDKKVVGVTGPCDILIFGPFGETWRSFPENIPKIHYTGENTKPVQRADINLNIGYEHTTFNDGRYIRIPLWMLSINWFRADADRINNPKPMPIDRCCKVFPEELRNKTKFCAFVVTNPRQPLRNYSFQWLNTYKPVDSAGRLFNNIGDEIFAGLGGGGGELRKLEFMKSYKFCLSYENESEPGYTTEKLLHAKAAGCIPIYWGDPKVERDFDTAGLIDARTARTSGELIRLVQEVDENDELWRKKHATPALDTVRHDMVRRTLSECARRIWQIAGATESELEGIPRMIGYTCDALASKDANATASEHGEASAAEAANAVPQPLATTLKPQGPESTIFMTGCNEKFLPSLQLFLRSLSPVKELFPNTQVHVYLMPDVTESVEQNFIETYPFTQFHRFPNTAPADFPDLWAPEHFAWKLWILKEAANNPAFSGKIVLYIDTGAIFVRWPQIWLDAVRSYGICALADPREFNKYRCHEGFVKGMNMNTDELNANQIWAGSMCFISGHPLAVKLFDESWVWGQKRHIIAGEKCTGQVIDGYYFGHRHDQSILSLLAKRLRVPVCDLDLVYCDTSLRHTFLTDRSLYVHRGLYKIHQQVVEGIDEAWIINLDRRQDRLERFKKTHPDLARRVMRLSAFEGSRLELTPKLARLFKPHDFNWKKPVMGCALSHLAMWVQLINEKPDINTYLILEDDARLNPGWRAAWEKAVDDDLLPKDWDLVYLGGILPPNREGFEALCVEKINDSVARVKENTVFGQTPPNRYFHFCAYAYVLTRKGAQKVVEFLKARGGYWTSADHMMCNIMQFLNIYFLHPLVAGCYQDDDPAYCNSAFNDFSRVDNFDSDLWNNTERFSDAEVASALCSGDELDIIGALEDARTAMNKSIRLKAEKAPEVVASTVVKTVVEVSPNLPKLCKRRIVSIGFDTDSSKWHEFEWLKSLFGSESESGIGLNVERIDSTEVPTDEPVVFVQRPHAENIRKVLARWSAVGAKFYVLHLSDEYSTDPVDFYEWPTCLGVVRTYIRDDLTANPSEKVYIIPLGPHWSVPGVAVQTHTPRPPFRELVWSFIGTGWMGRKEKLELLRGIPGDNRCVLMDEWNSPNMIGREESLAVLLNSWTVPCPGGQNAETFRIYEALEAGAVPILVNEEKMGKFLGWLGSKLPLIVGSDWTHAANIIHTLRAKPEVYEEYRNNLLAAWEAMKTRVREDVARVFRI
jgi:GR25 family glycosyltransferase involved in LPS biosynthesis